MEKKKFRMKASYVTHLYLDVMAQDKDEAYDIASETDGGEWTALKDQEQGEFIVETNNCRELI